MFCCGSSNDIVKMLLEFIRNVSVWLVASYTYIVSVPNSFYASRKTKQTVHWDSHFMPVRQRAYFRLFRITSQKRSSGLSSRKCELVTMLLASKVEKQMFNMLLFKIYTYSIGNHSLHKTLSTSMSFGPKNLNWTLSRKNTLKGSSSTDIRNTSE